MISVGASLTVTLFVTSWMETYPLGSSADPAGAVMAPLTGAIIAATETSTRDTRTSVAGPS